MTVSVNKESVKIVDEMISQADVLGIKCFFSKVGSTIIDCGIEVPGGYQAGLYVAKVCLGGLGAVALNLRRYDDFYIPVIEEFIDNPIIACMASQYAGWSIKYENFTALGSGPARALALKPKKLFQKIGYKDDFDEAVIVLETSKYPPDGALVEISNKCSINPKNLYVIVVPTNSIAGSIQVSSRIVEVGMHRLDTLGFELKSIVYGAGVCPIAPVHPDPTIMIGRTNDAIIYAGEVDLMIVYDKDEDLKSIVKNASSDASSSYGKTFYEIFKEAGFDFYNVDPKIFAPASITLRNISTGRSYRSGTVNRKLLIRSFELE